MVARPEIYQHLGERILKLGEPLLAYDVLSEGLEHFPGDTRMRQLQGLALARAGPPSGPNWSSRSSTRRGTTTRRPWVFSPGRTRASRLGDTTPTTRATLGHLRRSLELYSEAYDRFGGYWTGINAATLALLLDDKDRATALAGRVREQGLRELEKANGQGGDAYWPLATLGEAALVLGQLAEAEDWYGRAADDREQGSPVRRSQYDPSAGPDVAGAPRCRRRDA